MKVPQKKPKKYISLDIFDDHATSAPSSKVSYERVHHQNLAIPLLAPPAFRLFFLSFFLSFFPLIPPLSFP